MKLNYIIIFISVNLSFINLYAQTIATVNIDFLINNNSAYKDVVDKIENSQKKYLSQFEIKENEFNQILEDIENSKLILSENELNKKIEDYNIQISSFANLVDEFNFHYQEQIINIRENILKEVIVLLEKYAIENNVDLVLDSTSYLIASNSLDITTFINIELEKLNLKLEYIDFEKN